MLPRVSKTLSGQDIDRHARRAAVATSSTDPDARELTDEELILTSPIVYGFGFADKQWREYSSRHCPLPPSSCAFAKN